MSLNREDNIRRLLKQVYKPAVPCPEFKERLLRRLRQVVSGWRHREGESDHKYA